MNSKYLFVAILVTSFSFPVSTLAQSATVTPRSGLLRQFLESKKENLQELKENRQDTREANIEAKAEFKASITGTGKPDKTALRRQILTNNQTGLYHSFTVRFANLERYEKMILDRITQKLTRSPGNSELIAAQARLSAAELVSLKASYSTDLAKFQATVATINSSLNPKSLLPELRSEAKKINEDLKSIRKYLVNSLRLVVKVKVNVK